MPKPTPFIGKIVIRRVLRYRWKGKGKPGYDKGNYDDGNNVGFFVILSLP